jgi:hypothetical protein
MDSTFTVMEVEELQIHMISLGARLVAVLKEFQQIADAIRTTPK